MTPLPCPPVLLIFFNRADCVARTFSAIRAARPARLYLATDAPRPHVPDDAARCAAARAVVETQLDWPCVVHRDYAPANLGPNPRILSAIMWFFACEENGVVLEEDCLPHATFFPFCAELLARYADDPRISHISGDQFVPDGWRCPGDASYSCVRLAQIWGWASWRRAVRLLTTHPISSWPAARDSGLLHRIFPRARDRRYWRDRFDECHYGRSPVWDYRWAFARWSEGQLGLVPARNLVSNIGFRLDATNTTDLNHPAAAVPLHPAEFPLRHPPEIAPDHRLDRATARLLFSTGSLRARATYRLRQFARALARPFRR
jgi:hypothetical protein